MEAIISTLNFEDILGQKTFLTCNDDCLHGRDRTTPSAEEISIPYTFYADDAAFLFNSRFDLARAAPLIRERFALFGLKVHVGTADKPSKSVAMYFPGGAMRHSDGDTSDLAFEDGTTIRFVKQFKYLGQILTPDLKDDTEVAWRILKASQAFGALREAIFTRKNVSYESKRGVYVALVLPLLLYGCETWTVSSFVADHLSGFHHRCVRAMCRVSMQQTRDSHIKSTTLLERLKLRPIGFYLNRRRLGWLGRLARMDFAKAPQRRILTSWHRNPGAGGARRHGIGHSLSRTLENTKLLRVQPTYNSWMDVAKDEKLWKKKTKEIEMYQEHNMV